MLYGPWAVHNRPKFMHLHRSHPTTCYANGNSGSLPLPFEIWVSQQKLDTQQEERTRGTSFFLKSIWSGCSIFQNTKFLENSMAENNSNFSWCGDIHSLNENHHSPGLFEHCKAMTLTSPKQNYKVLPKMKTRRRGGKKEVAWSHVEKKRNKVQ